MPIKVRQVAQRYFISLDLLFFVVTLLLTKCEDTVLVVGWLWKPLKLLAVLQMKQLQSLSCVDLVFGRTTSETKLKLAGISKFLLCPFPLTFERKTFLQVSQIPVGTLSSSGEIESKIDVCCLRLLIKLRVSDCFLDDLFRQNLVPQNFYEHGLKTTRVNKV